MTFYLQRLHEAQPTTRQPTQRQNLTSIYYWKILNLFLLATQECSPVTHSSLSTHPSVVWSSKGTLTFPWWQWCWWHCHVGDFNMVTDLRCWWQNHYVGDSLCGDFLNVLNRSPTSQTCHQHIWSPTSVTNIDVTHSRCQVQINGLQWYSERRDQCCHPLQWNLQGNYIHNFQHY